MTVVSTTPVTQATTQDKSSAATASLTADFDLFLKLLTTQMQNQDPMNPMDSSQYTQQLVQYSQVEQSIQQNKTLNSILTGLTTQSLTQSSSMIGQQIEINSDTAGLSASTPAQWNWSATKTVDSLTATVLDAKGNKVDTWTIPATTASGVLSWDGSTTSGAKAADGVYQLKLEGKDSAGNTIAVTPTVTGTVANVQMTNGDTMVTINGAQYSTTSIMRVGSN